MLDINYCYCFSINTVLKLVHQFFKVIIVVIVVKVYIENWSLDHFMQLHFSSLTLFFMGGGGGGLRVLFSPGGGGLRLPFCIGSWGGGLQLLFCIGGGGGGLRLGTKWKIQILFSIFGGITWTMQTYAYLYLNARCSTNYWCSK